MHFVGLLNTRKQRILVFDLTINQRMSRLTFRKLTYM